MNRGRLGVPLLAYALLILAWIYQTRVFIPQLPETVTAHFDFSGRPDGSMSREAFRVFSIALQGGLAGFFMLLAFLMPRIPAKYVSMPHAEYWLGGERRASSLAELTRMILWIGALSFAFTLMIIQGVIRANLAETAELGRQFWIAMGFYIGAMALLLVKFYERFGRRDDSVGA